MTGISLVCAVYVSHAVRRMTESELEAILEISRRNNAADGITGQLIYADGNFIQAIEGPEAEIDALLARVQADRRHKGVVLIARWPIDERAFPDWTMAFRRMPRAEAEAVAGLLPTPSDPPGAGGGKAAVAARLLAEFRRSNPLH